MLKRGFSWKSNDWGHSSAGRASALQAGGRRFDPDWLQKRSEERVKDYRVKKG